MFEFAWPWMFLLLPLPYLFWRLPARASSQTIALQVPSLSREDFSSTKQNRTVWWRFTLLIVIWLLLTIAAARPQWLGEPVNMPAQGRDLMVAVDLSGSMKETDMVVNGRRVNRLAMVKNVLNDFIQRREGDRVGLILFADTAYLQAPLTQDRETVNQLLDESVIGLVGEQTAIGDAIGLAAKRFNLKNESNKVLILLTDGQNTAGNITPEQATDLAKAHGITIYTIGVGAGQNGQSALSLFYSGGRELDESSLKNIAAQTGGQYFRAKNTQELEQIYITLDKLEPIERESKQLRPLNALFYYPLSAALLLSFLTAALPIVKWLIVLIRRRSNVQS